jgi:hypothetical protein
MTKNKNRDVAAFIAGPFILTFKVRNYRGCKSVSRIELIHPSDVVLRSDTIRTMFPNLPCMSGQGFGQRVSGKRPKLGKAR